MKSFIISAIAGLFLFSASAFADCQYSDGTWAPEGTKSADNKICRNGEWVRFAAGGVPVGGGAIQIHQMNSNAFGFDYTFAMDNWNNISGIVVTNTFGYKMTNTNGYCPIYLEAGDKVVSINGINLLNEYSIQQAIQSAVQGMTVRFVNIRNGNWQTYYCQNGL
jgi:hypothetical protein